ncbi:sugar kinase [Streptosporangium sp. NPDC048865]|uniref:sugar kinase n=1 Tax=Streptosporangium sp. NPDC048865 TaxID=3155766 RepID=UPI00344A0884
MTDRPLDLFTLGEVMTLVRGTSVGPLRPGTAAEISFAGAEATVAIVAGRLGHTAAWCGRVGADGSGEMILAGLRAEGVEVSAAVIDPDQPTGLLLRHPRTARTTAVAYHREGKAGSRLLPSDIPEQPLRSARILHITGITPALSPSAAEAVDHAVRLARDAGVTVSLDVNYRQGLWPRERAAPVLRRLAAHADIVFAGTGEAALVLGAPDGTPPSELAAALTALGPREAVLKLGAAGALTLSEDGIEQIGGLDVPVLDPVGAGDCFVGGYLSAVLDGLPAHRRLERGNLCGAYSVSTTGDWEGAPRRTELAQLTAADNVLR